MANLAVRRGKLIEVSEEAFCILEGELIMAVKIVMGASCCGKSKFTEKYFGDWARHSVGDIQRAMKKELREQGTQFIDKMSVIIDANEKIKELVVEDLKAGKDTLHIKLLTGEIRFNEIEEKSKKIIERIMNEPASLLEEEEEI